jgi:hypothetical protein
MLQHSLIYLLLYKHYSGNLNKLKLAFRIYSHLKDEGVEELKNLNATRDINKEDSWSMNKLQATCFLRADADIRSECMKKNVHMELASEEEMNAYCAKAMVTRLLDEVIGETNLTKAHITVDVVNSVCKILIHVQFINFF